MGIACVGLGSSVVATTFLSNVLSYVVPKQAGLKIICLAKEAICRFGISDTGSKQQRHRSDCADAQNDVCSVL